MSSFWSPTRSESTESKAEETVIYQLEGDDVPVKRNKAKKGKANKVMDEV